MLNPLNLFIQNELQSNHHGKHKSSKYQDTAVHFSYLNYHSIFLFIDSQNEDGRNNILAMLCFVCCQGSHSASQSSPLILFELKDQTKLVESLQESRERKIKEKHSRQTTNICLLKQWTYLIFFNQFTLSKAIMPLRGNGLQGVKKNEKTLEGTE